MVEYDGVRVSAENGRRLAAAGNAYVYRVNRRESIDGSVPYNLARHGNHSCSPNAESRNIAGRIWLCAVKPIPKGEEITCDDGYSFRADPVPCLCRSLHSAGIIVATRDRDRIRKFNRKSAGMALIATTSGLG